MASSNAPDPTFGERLRAARQDAELSLMEAAFALRSRLPQPLWVSIDPIRRMEIGKTLEEDADPILVCALAAVYGVSVRDLSPLVAESIGLVDQLLHATSQEEVDDHGNRLTIWLTDAYQVVNEDQMVLEFAA